MPRRLIKVTRPSGVNVYFVSSTQKWTFFGRGNQPVDDWGCDTDLIDDDGTAEFSSLYERATESPVITSE